MGRKRTIKAPVLDQYTADSLSRFVSVNTLCEKYGLSKQQVKMMASVANAFTKVRRTTLIDKTRFYLEYKDILDDLEVEAKFKQLKHDDKILPIRKVYMRYEEAAEYYSMSLTCFKAFAKEADIEIYVV